MPKNHSKLVTYTVCVDSDLAVSLMPHTLMQTLMHTHTHRHTHIHTHSQYLFTAVKHREREKRGSEVIKQSSLEDDQTGRRV